MTKIDPQLTSKTPRRTRSAPAAPWRTTEGVATRRSCRLRPILPKMAHLARNRPKRSKNPKWARMKP